LRLYINEYEQLCNTVAVNNIKQQFRHKFIANSSQIFRRQDNASRCDAENMGTILLLAVLSCSRLIQNARRL